MADGPTGEGSGSSTNPAYISRRWPHVVTGATGPQVTFGENWVEFGDISKVKRVTFQFAAGTGKAYRFPTGSAFDFNVNGEANDIVPNSHAAAFWDPLKPLNSPDAYAPGLYYGLEASYGQYMNAWESSEEETGAEVYFEDSTPAQCGKGQIHLSVRQTDRICDSMQSPSQCNFTTNAELRYYGKYMASADIEATSIQMTGRFKVLPGWGEYGTPDATNIEIPPSWGANPIRFSFASESGWMLNIGTMGPVAAVSGSGGEGTGTGC
eukprot:3856111-Rhodomonas_salina.1